MKITVLSCLLVICCVATSFQPAKRALALPDWVTCQVDSRFSAQLPVQPTEIDMMQAFTSQGITPSAEQLEQMKAIKILTATDGIANYMITRNSSGTEINLDEPGNRTLYYDGAVKGLMQKERGTLLERSAFTVNGVEGVELSYKGVHKATGKFVVKHNRILAIDKALYILAVYPVDRNDSTGINLKEQRTKFFNSIAYKSSPKSSK